MSLKPGKLLLILLLPVVIYGVVKGVMYYNAKRTVDDIVTAVSGQVDIRYRDISTDIRGAVTVSGITVQPIGTDDTAAIGRVHLASDDLMFFLRGGRWQPDGDSPPPNSLAFQVSDVKIPLAAAFIDQPGNRATPAPAADATCAQGLEIDPQMLKAIGFSQLGMDIDGSYRFDETQKTLEFGMNVDVHDIESVQMAATLSDVDREALAQGAAPSLNLARLSASVRVSPAFGRQVIKRCASGSEKTLEEWSGELADRSIAQFEQAGIVLGGGLRRAVHDFYRDWGEFKLLARPGKPVGLLSLMFLPPDQLADALALQLSLNGQPITDTSFSWQKPDARDLSALFGGERPQADQAPAKRPKRIIVRRQFEPVAIGSISQFVDHQVKIKPRGLPVREGLLRRVTKGEAEVEQTLHGGKYTVYVPLGEIESVQALIQREVPPPQ